MAVLETFEGEIGTWVLDVDTGGDGDVVRSDEQAYAGTHSAKCLSTTSGDVARVYDDTDHPDDTYGYVWSRCYVYIPTATVNALSGSEYLELAGFYPNAGGNYGWWVQVRENAELYVRGYTSDGSGSTFKIYGTIPTGQWVELEIGLNTNAGNAGGRSFAFLIDGDLYGWYHMGNHDNVHFDRTAVGIVNTNSNDELMIYIDQWMDLVTTQAPGGTDNRSTADYQEIDFRDLSGIQLQMDYGTWSLTHTLDSTYGLVTESRIQAGKEHEKIGAYEEGWALIEIGWPNGTPDDTTPTGFFAPMIAFRKDVFTESNLEIVPYGGGDGTVNLRYESWPLGGIGTVFHTWALPEASIGGGSHIPEAGDKIFVRWHEVTASTLRVIVDYYDDSESEWHNRVIDSIDDLTAEGGENFMDSTNGSVTITTDGADYSIKYLRFGVVDTMPRKRLTEGNASTEAMSGIVRVTTTTYTETDTDVTESWDDD